jgi:hypothetical protein
MNAGSTVFSQLMNHASRFVLDRSIRRYGGNRGGGVSTEKYVQSRQLRRAAGGGAEAS